MSGRDPFPTWAGTAVGDNPRVSPPAFPLAQTVEEPIVVRDPSRIVSNGHLELSNLSDGRDGTTRWWARHC